MHNLLDWWRKAQRILEQYRAGHGQVRLTLNERVQHVLLLASFITLVVTGLRAEISAFILGGADCAVGEEFPPARLAASHRGSGADRRHPFIT